MNCLTTYWKNENACVGTEDRNGGLQNRGFSVYSKLRSEFLKIRRWSLGLRRWMRGRTRQGEPGERNCRFKIADFRLIDAFAKVAFSSQIANWQSTIKN